MIIEMLKALSAGRQLKNSAGWKNAQTVTAAIAAILGAIGCVFSLLGIHISISADDAMQIGSAVAILYGMFHGYATVATTKTLGLPPVGRHPDDAGKPDQTDVIG